MAQARRTFFSLGGPTYIDDPRVTEAQNQQRIALEQQALMDSRASKQQALAMQQQQMAMDWLKHQQSMSAEQRREAEDARRFGLTMEESKAAREGGWAHDRAMHGLSREEREAMFGMETGWKSGEKQKDRTHQTERDTAKAKAELDAIGAQSTAAMERTRHTTKSQEGIAKAGREASALESDKKRAWRGHEMSVDQANRAQDIARADRLRREDRADQQKAAAAAAAEKFGTASAGIFQELAELATKAEETDEGTMRTLLKGLRGRAAIMNGAIPGLSQAVEDHIQTFMPELVRPADLGFWDAAMSPLNPRARDAGEPVRNMEQEALLRDLGLDNRPWFAGVNSPWFYGGAR